MKALVHQIGFATSDGQLPKIKSPATPRKVERPAVRTDLERGKRIEIFDQQDAAGAIGARAP